MTTKATTTTETSAVATVQKYAVLTTGPQELAEIIRLNAGSDGLSQFDLETIKVPAGGGTTWEWEGIDGPESGKTLEGVIVAQRSVRAYWGTDEMTGSPPDCKSDDGVMGTGTPGGKCGECPLAEFGSGKGQSQACKAMKLLFLVMPDQLLPVVLRVPPSSLQPVRAYMLRLASRATRHYAVLTQFTLEKAQNPDGISYAKVTAKAAGRLSQEQAEAMQKYAEALGPIFERAAAAATEASGPDAGLPPAEDEVPF